MIGSSTPILPGDTVVLQIKLFDRVTKEPVNLAGSTILAEAKYGAGFVVGASAINAPDDFTREVVLSGLQTPAFAGYVVRVRAWVTPLDTLQPVAVQHHLTVEA